jgi:anti-sigma factor RsiW
MMNGNEIDDERQPTPHADETLVAYLDGELDADGMSEVERRLADDEQFRRRLHELENAWRLLDGLPRADVDETFAQSTVEMVAVEAAEELRTMQFESVRRRRRNQVVGAVSLVAAALLGFTVAYQFLPNEDDRLLEDLPVVERLEQYQQVESLEFLKLLVAEDVFPEEIGDEQ